jgi:hypothetical protein
LQFRSAKNKPQTAPFLKWKPFLQERSVPKNSGFSTLNFDGHNMGLFQTARFGTGIRLVKWLLKQAAGMGIGIPCRIMVALLFFLGAMHQLLRVSGGGHRNPWALAPP